jgi:hypothetical protein
MSDHDRPRRRWLRRDALQPACPAHPVRGEPADLRRDLRHHGRYGVVVVGVDPHYARRLGGAEPDREHGPERDRDLSEDVAGQSLPEHALDPVDEPGRLDATLEHGEEGSLGALVRRVLARHEADVGGHSGEPLALGRVQAREERDAGDLLGGHHGA